MRMFDEKISRRRLCKKFVYYRSSNPLAKNPLRSPSTIKPETAQQTTKFDDNMSQAEGTSTENSEDRKLSVISPNDIRKKFDSSRPALALPCRAGHSLSPSSSSSELMNTYPLLPPAPAPRLLPSRPSPDILLDIGLF